MRCILPLLVCTLFGFWAGKPLSAAEPSLYESQAKILVRYVVNTSQVNLVKGSPAVVEEAARSKAIITKEVEILGSNELAADVIKAVGSHRLIKGSGSASAESRDAAQIFQRDLRITRSEEKPAILLSFRSTDPELPKLVLDEYVHRYLQRHLEAYRSDDVIMALLKKCEEARTQVVASEEKLQKLQTDAAASPDAAISLGAQIERLKADRDKQKLALAESQTKLEKERIDQTLNPSRMPNISVTEQPATAREITR